MARRRGASSRAAGASPGQGESPRRRRQHREREPEDPGPVGVPEPSTQEGPGRDDPRCEVCGDTIPPSGRVDCQDCGTPHHADCFAYLGQCSVYGCGSARRKANPAGGETVQPGLLVMRYTGPDRESGQRRAASSEGGEGRRGREGATRRHHDTRTSLRIGFKRALFCGIGMLAMSSACSSAVETPGQALLALIVGIGFLIAGFLATDETILKMR